MEAVERAYHIAVLTCDADEVFEAEWTACALEGREVVAPPEAAS